MQKRLRILAITSHYPPFHVGGYEVRCKNVLDRLSERGCEIRIIVSDYPEAESSSIMQEKNIYRIFHLLDSSRNMIGRTIRDYNDIRALDRIIDSFKPDLIYLWNIINLTKAIFPYLAERGLPIVYDEGGAGLIYSWHHGGSWYAFLEGKSKSRFKNGLKAIAGKMVSKLSGNLIKTQWKWPGEMCVYFNSELGRSNSLEHAVPVERSPVIYSGLDSEKFSFRGRDKINSPIRIIVPGRIETPKGQKDSVLLLQFLREKNLEAHLTIVGKSNSDRYYQEIERTITQLDMGGRILMLPMVDHDQLVKLYHQSDICFFPSTHRYGFSRIPLEAMACGCLVITYGCEGSNEIIEDRRTGYIVSPKDFQAMVSIMQQAMCDAPSYRQLIANARQVVEQKYSMDAYIDRIESFLLDAINLKNQPSVHA